MKIKKDKENQVNQQKGQVEPSFNARPAFVVFLQARQKQYNKQQGINMIPPEPVCSQDIQRAHPNQRHENKEDKRIELPGPVLLYIQK